MFKSIFSNLFINKEIAFIFTGQVLSQAGDSIFYIGLIWIILEKTNSTEITGLFGSLAFIPYLFFTLPGGLLADRFSKKNIMLLSDGARFVLVMLIFYILSKNYFSLILIGIITFSIESFSACFYPSRDALIPQLVPKEKLSHANGLIQVSWQVASLIGPAFAGILLRYLKTVNLFSIDAITFLISFLLIFFIKKEASIKENPENPYNSFKEGFKYAMKDPLIRIILIITFLNNLILMGPAVVGVPIFVKNILKKEVFHYAFLESAFAGGAIIGAPLIIYLGKKFSFSKLLVLGIFLDGITYLPFFFIKNFEMALFAIFFHSIFIPMITVSRTTLIQSYVPEKYWGRVISLFQFAVIGGAGISSLITGFIAKYFQINWIFLFMSILASSCAIPGFISKSIREYKNQK